MSESTGGAGGAGADEHTARRKKAPKSHSLKLFSYGSLVNEESEMRTMPRTVEKDASSRYMALAFGLTRKYDYLKVVDGDGHVTDEPAF